MSVTGVEVHPARASRLTATFRQLFATDLQCLAFCEMCVADWYDLGPEEEPTYIHPRAAFLSKKMHRQLGEFREAVGTASRASKFITVAESTAKFAYDFAGKGQSRVFAKRFFLELCPSPCAALLAYALRTNNPSDAFDRLYEIRNLAVHRDKHTNVNFDEPVIRDAPTTTSLGELLRAKLSGNDNEQRGPTVFEALQHLIVSGCHVAICKALDADCVAQECPGHARFVRTVCRDGSCKFLEQAGALSRQAPGQNVQGEV